MANIDDFLKFHTPFPYPCMEALCQEGLDRNFPIIESAVGNFLQMQIALKKPHHILDIGCGYGYSSLWMASACEQAKMYLFDYDPLNLQRAESFLRENHQGIEIKTFCGDALLHLGEFCFEIDFAFLDIDKLFYSDAMAILLSRMKPGAFLVVDNLFFRGRIFEENSKKAGAQSIQKMMENLQDYKDCRYWILNLADGLLLIEKL